MEDELNKHTFFLNILLVQALQFEPPLLLVLLALTTHFFGLADK